MLIENGKVIEIFQPWKGGIS